MSVSHSHNHNHRFARVAALALVSVSVSLVLVGDSILSAGEGADALKLKMLGGYRGTEGGELLEMMMDAHAQRENPGSADFYWSWLEKSLKSRGDFETAMSHDEWATKIVENHIAKYFAKLRNGRDDASTSSAESFKEEVTDFLRRAQNFHFGLKPNRARQVRAAFDALVRALKKSDLRDAVTEWEPKEEGKPGCFTSLLKCLQNQKK